MEKWRSNEPSAFIHGGITRLSNEDTGPPPPDPSDKFTASNTWEQSHQRRPPVLDTEGTSHSWSTTWCHTRRGTDAGIEQSLPLDSTRTRHNRSDNPGCPPSPPHPLACSCSLFVARVYESPVSTQELDPVGRRGSSRALTGCHPTPPGAKRGPGGSSKSRHTWVFVRMRDWNRIEGDRARREMECLVETGEGHGLAIVVMVRGSMLAFPVSARRGWWQRARREVMRHLLLDSAPSGRR